MTDNSRNNPEKKSLQSRIDSSVELTDVKGVMRALAKDYFAAVTNITGNPRFINYYRNRVHPLEKNNGHYMDMIELVAYYTQEAIMKNPAELRGLKLEAEQNRVRKAEENLFRIVVEPLSHVYDVMKGYQPYAKRHKELFGENTK